MVKSMIYKTKTLIYKMCIDQILLLRATRDTTSIFKWGTADLNSVLSFS